MADPNADHNGNQLVPAPTPEVALRQQGAAAPDSGGRSAAPCDVVQTATRILRLPEVKARVGLCRASIYQRITEGSFPKQISLGIRAVGWLEHEIEAWIAERIKTGRRK